MKLASIDWSGGAPRLRDVRTFDPERGRFYEPYGFSPDGRRILFASDLHVRSKLFSPSATNAQIWTVSTSLEPSTVQRVSPGGTGGAFSNYNEFAAWVPGTDRILFGRTHDAGAHGIDYWTVAPDGSDPQRVTFLNERGTEQYRGYSVMGGFAFDPHDPRRLVAGVSHDLASHRLRAVFVTIGAKGLG
jgi:Tol biopolymer transport system component